MNPRLDKKLAATGGWRQLMLVATTAVLMTLASAPFGQWYLAWVALAPLLVAIGRTSSVRGAIWLGWVAGVMYFSANLWWLWTASIPGTIVLVLYLALFWALFAAIVRGLNLLRSHVTSKEGLKGSLWREAASVFGVATVWVAVEWVRCNIAVDFPWLPLGTTQAPLPVMCQVADIGGPWIVSFVVALPNALAAVWSLNRDVRSTFRVAAASVVVIFVVVWVYGVWRIQTTATTPGPRVMVIQSNFPHLPGGAATEPREQVVEYFLAEVKKRLVAEPADLVVLPEAAFPPLNDEARRELTRSPTGRFLQDTYERLRSIARERRAALLVGGNAVTSWSTRGGEHVGSEIRNCVYLFEPDGTEPVARYDKIYLVRFAERTAVSFGPQWLQRLLMGISAPRVAQPLYAGQLADLRPFQLKLQADANGTTLNVPFVSPICLENIDPAIVARFVRGSARDGKQAYFIANVSNDGWFAWQEKHQHWQTTLFRAIENRVAIVRSSNTGISGFIDSVGRVQETIMPATAGAAVRQIELDDRRTFYMRYGDVFAYLCVTISVGAIVAATFIRWATRR